MSIRQNPSKLNSFNRFIDNFQDQWETSSSFRAFWSTIGGAVLLVSICGTLLIVNNIASGFFAAQSTKSDIINPNQVNVGDVKFPIATFAPGTSENKPAPQAANPSTAPTPTPTVPAIIPTTEPTASITSTPTNFFIVNANQSPSPWVVGGSNNTMSISATPRTITKNATMKVHLDFGSGCTADIPSVNLDDNGTSSVAVTIPVCFTKTGTQDVKATFSITGYPDFVRPQSFKVKSQN
jgi:hypothetical protein